jgi:hypothetical protein
MACQLTKSLLRMCAGQAPRAIKRRSAFTVVVDTQGEQIRMALPASRPLSTERTKFRQRGVTCPQRALDNSTPAPQQQQRRTKPSARRCRAHACWCKRSVRLLSAFCRQQEWAPLAGRAITARYGISRDAGRCSSSPEPASSPCSLRGSTIERRGSGPPSSDGQRIVHWR